MTTALEADALPLVYLDVVWDDEFVESYFWKTNTDQRLDS